jgi:hypothetical protein
MGIALESFHIGDCEDLDAVVDDDPFEMFKLGDAAFSTQLCHRRSRRSWSPPHLSGDDRAGFGRAGLVARRRHATCSSLPDVETITSDVGPFDAIAPGPSVTMIGERPHPESEDDNSVYDHADFALPGFDLGQVNNGTFSDHVKILQDDAKALDELAIESMQHCPVDDSWEVKGGVMYDKVMVTDRVVEA